MVFKKKKKKKKKWKAEEWEKDGEKWGKETYNPFWKDAFWRRWRMIREKSFAFFF